MKLKFIFNFEKFKSRRSQGQRTQSHLHVIMVTNSSFRLPPPRQPVPPAASPPGHNRAFAAGV